MLWWLWSPFSLLILPLLENFTTPLHWITILLGRVVTKVLACDSFIVEQCLLLTTCHRCTCLWALNSSTKLWFYPFKRSFIFIVFRVYHSDLSVTNHWSNIKTIQPILCKAYNVFFFFCFCQVLIQLWGFFEALGTGGGALSTSISINGLMLQYWPQWSVSFLAFLYKKHPTLKCISPKMSWK